MERRFYLTDFPGKPLTDSAKRFIDEQVENYATLINEKYGFKQHSLQRRSIYNYTIDSENVEAYGKTIIICFQFKCIFIV